MKVNKKKKLTLPAESRNLIKVRSFVVRLGRKMGLLEKQVSELKLAVDEACSNIIRHAYGGGGGTFTIEMTRLESAVEIRIIDRGAEFDWNSVLEPDLYKYVETRRKGGLGIWLIKKLIDEVEYKRVDGSNILTMTVYLKEGAVEAAVGGRTRFPIRVRFALYAVALITVLIVIVFNIGSRYQIRTIRQKFVERYKTLTEQLAETSADLILKGDTLQLVNLAASVKESEKPLEYVVIINDQGTILADTETNRIFTTYNRPRGVRQLTARDPVDVTSYQGRGGRTFNNFAVAITYNNSKLGEVHIGIPEDKFAEVNDLVTQRLRVAFIALFFWSSTIVGVFFIGSTFISPIRKLADEIALISTTGEAAELRFSSRNPEVSRIGEAFNEIMRNLRITQGQLTDQTRLRRELQLAQEIQNALLPNEIPTLEGFDISAAYRAATEVGGDYYDFFEVDENAIGIVVADVSGKGIGSSMVMTMIRTSMRLEARGNKRASYVLNKVNKVATGDIKKGMYVTMFYIILDSKKRIGNYASAGHNPMIIYRADTKSVSFLNPGGIAVGIDLGDPDEFRKRITSEKLKLKKGDLLFAFTDGITEAMNEQREQFGESRLVEFIKKFNHLSATDFKNRLNDEVEKFTKGYPQSDDITFVVIKLEMSLAEIEYSNRMLLFQLLDDGMALEEALEQTGISQGMYEELRAKREQFGDEALGEVPVEDAEKFEQKHATHEQVRMIVQIVRQNPDYGTKRITTTLKSPEFESQDIKESVVQRELVRLKLETREKREAFARRELPSWASYR
jgi:serine phosphatase RsbU (regulator of sigma subunit)/anti-sigma regulatory factor (Ser/Thr protein kinase)